MGEQPIALKEWAVAVKALREGAQSLIMRKGGIIEETRDFEVRSQAFYLYPTYEHQRRELLKDEYDGHIEETLQEWAPGKPSIPVTCYAEVVEDIEVYDQLQLDSIRKFHIWTDRFAGERLKWKRQSPLHVLLLRVYELETPVEIPILPEYCGCKSWIQIGEPSPFPVVKRRPVIGDDDFQRLIDQIKQALTP